MPVPQVTGTLTLRNATTSAVLDTSSIPNGSWMLISAMSSSTGTSLTPPATWTVLAPAETTGTRRNFLFGKIKDASDGSSVTIAQSSTNTVAYALMWGTGSSDIAGWIVGSTRVRSVSGEPSGARYTNTAPSITTTANDHLVLAISHEATLAQTQTNEVASVSPNGWTQQLWFPQVAPNDQIETIWIGSKELVTPASSGDVTLTYTSPQDNNGWAVQVAIPHSIAPILTIPQVVGTPTQFISGSVTTGFSIARPSGVANGDYIVVAIRSQGGFTSEPTSTGFTRLGAATVLNDSSSRGHGLYGKPVTDALNEPTTYTFSYSTGSSRAIALAFIVRGVDLTHPIAGFNNNYAGTTVTGGKQTPSYTLETVPALNLFMGSSEFASPNDHVPLTTPTGFTSFAEVPSSTNTGVSRTYVWLGTKVQSTSPTDTVQITWSGAAGPAAEMISFQGLTSAPPPAEGYGFNSRNGAGGVVKVFHTTASGVRTPSDMVPMRPGFANVSALLAKPGATWAHRGGSVSYPEMSLYAYTQSVARGYGALEVSLARTSDGVWFGLHDQSTDRTSGGTYGNASTQTWAQVQAQNIVIGATGAPQPYMRWEELIAAYGKSHVFIVDPKYALGSYRTEFLDMVDRDLGPTKAIIKFSGGGSGATALSTAAIARGYQTWGFFYATDASATQGGSGSLQTWGPYWTMIGMDYTASQAVWDEALALGKPVIGHIAPSQSAYNTAMSKGASGVQVSGVGVVTPVSWWT